MNFRVVLLLGVYFTFFLKFHLVILGSFHAVLNFREASHFRTKSRCMIMVVCNFLDLTVFRWTDEVFLKILFIWIKLFWKTMLFLFIKFDSFKTGFLSRDNFILLLVRGSNLWFEWEFLLMFLIYGFRMWVLCFKDHILIGLIGQQSTWAIGEVINFLTEHFILFIKVWL